MAPLPLKMRRGGTRVIRKRFKLASFGKLEFTNSNGEVVARARVSNASLSHRANVERSMLGMLYSENVRNKASGEYVYSDEFDVRDKIVGRDIGTGWEVAHPSNNMVRLGRTFGGVRRKKKAGFTEVKH